MAILASYEKGVNTNLWELICPALLLILNQIVLVFFGGSRAVARIGEEGLQNYEIFLPSINFFIHPLSVLSSQA